MRPPASDRAGPETGATLVVAVVFLAVVGLIAVALGTMATGGLLATSGLRSERTAEYAADSAVEAAIQGMRYSYAYDGGAQASWCLPPFTGVPPTGSSSTTVNGFQVACSGSQNLYSGRTRTVTFSACKGPGAIATTTACTGPAAQAPVVQASVSFDDYTAATPPVLTCAQSSTLTCGIGLTINSWVVLTTNS